MLELQVQRKAKTLAQDSHRYLDASLNYDGRVLLGWICTREEIPELTGTDFVEIMASAASEGLEQLADCCVQ